MITKQQIQDSVKNFRAANLNSKLTQGNKSSVYQLIIDDYNSRNGKPVSRRRKNKTEKNRPEYVAPAQYGEVDGRQVEVLWPCEMIKVDSSWIVAIGYNAEQRVMKMQTEKYTYAYQDVPEAAFRTFLSTNSPGSYYSKFRKLYRGVALV